MNTKADVRAAMRSHLPLPEAERSRRSAAICEAIIHDPGWAEARVAAIFAPQATEPDVERLWPHRRGRLFCYPRVRDAELDFFCVADPASLVAGRWGLREPASEEKTAILSAEIDLIIVPGVAFTRRGERLGRGGGFYDRFLSGPDLRARKLGVCFDVQLMDALPVEAHDARMDAIIAA